MKKIGKRTWILLGVVAVAAVSAIGAYAYFTTTGSGAGTATTGTNTALTIDQGTAPTGLTPGGGAKTVPYSITNAAGNGTQNLGKVSITGLTVDSTHALAGCDVAWYSVTESASAIGTITDNSTFNSTGSTEPKIQLNNIASSQNACRNATLSFTLSAAAGS